MLPVFRREVIERQQSLPIRDQFFGLNIRLSTFFRVGCISLLVEIGKGCLHAPHAGVPSTGGPV
jgi:hypothetical protein